MKRRSFLVMLGAAIGLRRYAPKSLPRWNPHPAQLEFLNSSEPRIVLMSTPYGPRHEWIKTQFIFTPQHKIWDPISD